MLEIHSRIARCRVPAVSLAALCVAAGVLTGCGDAGATITRLTVGTPGPDPYRLVSNTDQMKVAKRQKQGGTRDGDTPGLYGGTRHASSCDQQKLVTFLRANPDKARAWAKVQGIPVSDIPRYVSRLTPVLLRTDTLVTNHGYHNGKATSGPAVLQAGMGVLVNGYGVPTVKCNCGNPLTQPEKKISTRDASYHGRSWPGFEKRNVTKVRPRDSGKGTVATFVLVDPEGTMGFQRPRATDGPSDGLPTALPPTETLVPTESPTPTDSGSSSPGTGVPTEESGTPSPEVSTEPGQTTGEPTEPGQNTGEPTDGPTGGGPTGAPYSGTGMPGEQPQNTVSMAPGTPGWEPPAAG